MDEPQSEGRKPDGDTMGVKPKKKYRSKKEKDEDLDTVFEAAFGLGLGLAAGAAFDRHLRAAMQIMGMPHEEDDCVAGENCARHGKKKEEE